MIPKKKILIIKHGSVGDIFMSFDSLEAISDLYGSLTLCSTKNGFKLFELLNINFNKIIDNRSKNPFLNLKVIFQIINGKFDLVIDLQNSKRTSVYLFFLKLFTKSISNGTSKFATHRYISSNLNEHAKEGLQNQLSLLGISQRKNLNPIKRIVKKQIIFVPGSSINGKHKRWPIKYYIEVMKYFSKNKIKSIVIGGADEKDISDFIPKDDPLIVNLIGKSPWPEVKKIALHSIITVTNDTSAMHFISNLNLPILAIMNDNKYAQRNYPLSDRSIVIKSMNINDITQEEVINEISKFIK